MSGTAISLAGSDHVVEMLQQLTRRASDLTPVMRSIGEGLVTSTQMRFETETDPQGRPWVPLSITTLFRRAAYRQKRENGWGDKYTVNSATNTRGAVTKKAQTRMMGAKILQVLGHLKDSIHHVAGRDQVEVGSNLVYARIHQYGGKAGRGQKVTIPARPYLGIDDADAASIVDTLRSYLGEMA